MAFGGPPKDSYGTATTRTVRRGLAGMKGNPVAQEAALKRNPSSQGLRNQAALMALKERRASSPAERLTLQADEMDLSDTVAGEAAAGNLANRHARGLWQHQQGLPGTVEGPDPGMVNSQAMTVLGNIGGGVPMAKQKYGQDALPPDPRLSVQGRNEFDRIGAATADKHLALTSRLMQAADTEAQNLRERTRMQTEGDAYLLEQKRKLQTSPAVGALASR